MKKELLRWMGRFGVLIIYAAALILPAIVFFGDRGGTSFLAGADPQSLVLLLIPLFGLYAFTLVTMQVLLSTNLAWLTKLWPKIIYYHRWQGTVALLIAIFHPLLILIGYGLASYLTFKFVAPSLIVWVVLAELALTTLVFTVVTAHVAWLTRKWPWWRKLHRLNYVIFAALWLHSWFVGTDTRTSLLRTVWLVYLAAVVLSIIGRYYTKKRVNEEKTA